ncbi:MAG: site-2 protease family protein [Candidatus Aenigmatarchaeota archaeon]
MLDYYLLSVVAFFALLAVLIYRDRKKIQFSYYVLFMRRTTRFRNFINSVAKAAPRFWKVFGTIGVIVAFGAMFFGLYSMSQAAALALSGKIKEPSAGLVLPIPSSQPASIPGVIGIPFWFWIITIAIILIPHEFMHGVIARMEKVKLKSVGLLLLAIFPGAFVEPDEKQLAKKGLWARLRVFAAGSFINILIGLSVLFIVQTFLWSAAVQPGLLITSVAENSPAGFAGLKPGMVIQNFDGTPQIGFYDYSALLLVSKLPNSTTESAPRVMGQLLLLNKLSKRAPGDIVILEAATQETIRSMSGSDRFSITLGNNANIPNFAYLGVTTSLNTASPGNFVVLFPLLAFVWMLSFFVGIFNILPIYPLDGGLMVEAVAKRYAKKKSKIIVRAITLVTLFILLLNFIGPYVAKII